MSDTFAARFRALRDRAGLTQAQVGAMLGVSQARIGHIERGIRIPTVRWAVWAASLLGWSLDELMPEDGESAQSGSTPGRRRARPASRRRRKSP